MKLWKLFKNQEAKLNIFFYGRESKVPQFPLEGGAVVVGQLLFFRHPSKKLFMKNSTPTRHHSRGGPPPPRSPQQGRGGGFFLVKRRRRDKKCDGLFSPQITRERHGKKSLFHFPPSPHSFLIGARALKMVSLFGSIAKRKRFPLKKV